jgi:hypothetical protein
MCCDRCHRQIEPGTETTVWGGVKRYVLVCALCLPFATSIMFGQTSPTPEPAPLPTFSRRVSVDSGSSGTTNMPLGWRSQDRITGAVFVANDGEPCDTETTGFRSFTLSSCPTPLPGEDTPELPHPPHGEGSGELPIFVGIGASGAQSNVTNAMITSTSWEPPDQNHSAAGHFFLDTDPHAKHPTLQVGSVRAQRPMIPRARRSC